MKKPIFIMWWTLSWIMLCTVNSEGGPVGDPSRLSSNTGNAFTLGYEGSLVFDRDLDTRNGEIDELQDSYAKLSYLPQEVPVELYGLLGAMRYEAEQGNARYDTDFGFAYGFGATVPFWKNEKGAAIGLDAKYRRSEPDIDDSPFNSRGEAKYQDWQVALGMSQKLNENVIPYGGIKYNDVSITNVPGFASQNSEHVVGLFTGLEFETSEDVAFNVEGSFINETAVSGAAVWRF